MIPAAGRVEQAFAPNTLFSSPGLFARARAQQALVLGGLYGFWHAQPAQVPTLALAVGAAFAGLGCAASVLRWRVQVAR